MPVIKVCGLPNLPEDVLACLQDSLHVRVGQIPELKINPGLVSSFFPSDRLASLRGRELVVEVIISKKDDRPKAVQDKVASVVRDVLLEHLQKHLPRLTMIEVLIIPHDEVTQGFIRWDKPNNEDNS